MWSTFKHEYYYRHTFASASELVAAVDNWMHIYNTRRRHSTIGMLSPTNYDNVTDSDLDGRVTADPCAHAPAL
ncbi:integrase core domain-containing protein [Rhodococcus erythropolis]|uniref:integrase core domain-containing protein n=1 Tax=Rhodococcus erythropolis TaxID=1833 RepID=UPI0035B6A5B0